MHIYPVYVYPVQVYAMNAIRAKTMSVTGGVLESLRQVKKQCFFHFTLRIYDCIHVCVAIHVYMHTHICKVDR